MRLRPIGGIFCLSGYLPIESADDIEHVGQGILSPIFLAYGKEDSDVPPEYLELDLDEKVLETDNADLLATMKALNAMGVRLAIDDFGRGVSSIPRLRRYPLKALKLDPALVRGVGHDEDSEAVVEAIASLATTLGLEVFARGVETPAQRDFLRALDCHLQQGPLFGAPMNAHAFARSLR